MKHIAKYVLLFIVLFVLVSHRHTDDAQKNKIILELISQSLMKAHFNPQTVDDDFSEKVFDLYLERLDRNKRFLLQEDIEMLLPHKQTLDDEIKKGTYQFFEITAGLIEKRMEDAEEFYAEILAEPFNFKLDENVEFDDEKIDYAQNKEQLKERWRKLLKYQTLDNLQKAIKLNEKAKTKNDTSLQVKTFEELEADARQKIKKRYDEYFRRMHKIETEDWRRTYLNSITNVFDPHSSFYPPKDKKQFDIDMSGRLEGIGATLTERNGYIKVNSIVPGSAAWQQGDLKAGDIILKVAQGSDTPVDIVDMRLDKAVQLIRGKKGTEVRLTVQKVDESIEIIPIIRDVVIIEETYAKSAILKDEKEKNSFGYIYLPKFYVDFSSKRRANCARDVEKAIKKLKKQNVEGIILDLRNNSGGSLPYVVEIAGLFIEKGPIVQIKSRKQAPYILDDDNPDQQYDGPLVIMVNSFSASASEIMAAAMQDYQRAVIIGSSSTFGKGTVQRFYNFDKFIPSEMNDLKPLGSIKITTQKFYRINGGTTQCKGVVPDIVLPDAYSYIEVGEKEREYALRWDEIAPADYQTWDKSINYKKIVRKSKARINKHEDFELMRENALRLKKIRDIKNYTLQLNEYTRMKEEQKENADKYKNIAKQPTGLRVVSLPEDKQKALNDTIEAVKIEKWHKDLKKDIYLEEAVYVLQDML